MRFNTLDPGEHPTNVDHSMSSLHASTSRFPRGSSPEAKLPSARQPLRSVLTPANDDRYRQSAGYGAETHHGLRNR